MEEEETHVGSPSPPYEGVITEEAEKQLESPADFEEVHTADGDVNIRKAHLKSSFKHIPITLSRTQT